MISRMRWVAVVLVLASCGPIAYVGQVTLKADDAVEAARVSEADKYSPYWWTRATQYLYMAREVAAHADYQGANHFGRLATEAAEKAKAEADDPARRAIVNQSVVKPADAATPGPNGKIAPAKDPKDDIAPAKDPAP
jgi:sRNA-binding protein